MSSFTLEPDKYYKVSEVAFLFGVTPYTVREWIKSEKIKATRSPGGQYRIVGSEIKNYANKEYGNADQ